MVDFLQKISNLMKRFRRQWHLFSNSERTTVCGADCMLMVLQLSMAEVNKQVVFWGSLVVIGSLPHCVLTHGKETLQLKESYKADASWLPVYEEEEEAVDFIKDYIKNKERDDVQKMKLLRNIVTVFTTAQEKGLLEGLDTFCRENKLTANIQVLLEEKPIDYPCTDLWEEALLATSALSTVETVLEGEMLSLVAACVSSVFFLLRTEDLDLGSP
nr:PCNA-interacting partner-like [Anas platyrhynchos]